MQFCQGFEIGANLIWVPLWIPIRIQTMLIFHLKYIQLLLGRVQTLPKCQYFIKICVIVFHLIQNVNISLVINAILSGIGNKCKSYMGPPWIPIRILTMLIFHRNMCKCVPTGHPWIPIRILHGSYVFTADPKC